MKSFKLILIISISFAFLISSCTMQKRRYSQGYHIEWNHSKDKSNYQSSSENSSKIKEIEKEEFLLNLSDKDLNLPDHSSDDISIREINLVKMSDTPEAFSEINKKCEEHKNVKESRLVKKRILLKKLNSHRYLKISRTNLSKKSVNSQSEPKYKWMLSVGKLIYSIGAFLLLLGVVYYPVLAIVSCFIIITGLVLILIGMIIKRNDLISNGQKVSFLTYFLMFSVVLLIALFSLLAILLSG